MSVTEDLSLDQLEDEIAKLASHIYAGTCRWLELVGELDRRGGFTESGCGSCAEWLAWRCALAPRAAREHVRVARRLPELPLIHGAFASGELSYAKVRALTRVADEDSEEELLELARHLTAAQLERAVRAYRRVSVDEAKALEDAAHLGYCWDEDGSLVIRARLAPEDGALFLRALEAARDLLQERAWADERGSAEPPKPARRPSNAEALAAVADLALAGRTDGRPGGERYQLVVHVDEAAVTGDGGACVLEDGPALAPETARRLACDASIVELRERGGEPLSVGRKTRTIPPAMRRALHARDRGCRFPGCENRRFLDGHHVQHWARGGETKLGNLVLLCPHHHRWVHGGGYSIVQQADGSLSFRDPWGAPIPNVPRPPPGKLDRLLEPNRHLEIESWTCQPGDGDPLDLDLAVRALCQMVNAEGRAAVISTP
jgi:Domain of unknown function (DUF222)/HNH endonuclease